MTENSQRRPAAYASGSGTSALRFSYTVVVGDRDRRGVAVGIYDRNIPESSPLQMRCGEGGAEGTIRDAANNDMSPGHKMLLADANHKVGGSDVYPDDRIGPIITDMEVMSSPKSGDTYRDGEAILVRVTFNEPIVVDSVPEMGLWMGRDRKAMRYWRKAGDNQLILGYTVRPEDRDGNGISTEANMIIVYDELGVSDSADNPAKAAREAACEKCWTTLEHGPLPTHPGHKVAGSAADTTPPTIAEVEFQSSRGAYIAGDEIRMWVRLTKNMEVEAPEGVKPGLELTIGGKTRTASASGDARAPSDHVLANTLRVSWIPFIYTVQEGDQGDIAIPANSLKLPTGVVIRDGHDNEMTDLSHAAVNDTGRAVPSAYILERKLTVTSKPVQGNTYRAGETITISATFNTNVTVTGTPSIGMESLINEHGRVKLLYSGGSGTTTLTFSHVVGNRDSGGLRTDSHGIRLGGDATIKDADGNNTYLGHHRLPRAGHRVDGWE